VSICSIFIFYPAGCTKKLIAVPLSLFFLNRFHRPGNQSRNNSWSHHKKRETGLYRLLLLRLNLNAAIVNAIAHRDYTSNASVQVMLFADRLEVT